jgi:7,8-dihydropterin-6-yl-methyl-4-(beta-D-ribofuranosyl)aminobenzene 5'-phosphate synthase
MSQITTLLGYSDTREADMIEPVDSLEITVIVDNVTDILSSNPKYVETEAAGAWRRGMKWLGGKCLCCAAHGLSC